jgi:hypothetical protein
MFELRQLHLELAFPRAGALGEDIQNERGAIENLATEDSFQVARLGTGQLVVGYDRVHFQFLATGGKLGGLAGADERAGHGGFELLGGGARDNSPSSLGELGELLE